jgi:hypothetical protein
MAVVLHFSGYGYQKRGVPLWLVEGLRFWLVVRARAACCHFSMNYTRAGDLGKARSGYPRCRNTLRSILNLSSLAITPTDLYRKRLSRLRKDSAIKITAMPVFSNVGEPSCAIQRKLFTWYTAHSLTVQADFLVNSISRVLGPLNTMSIA